MKEIVLSMIFRDINPNSYKVHFARKSGNTEPLNEYIANFEYWKDWNKYSKSKDDFNREYIFSLINFFPERDTWLFGGIWRIVSRDAEYERVPYN